MISRKDAVISLSILASVTIGAAVCSAQAPAGGAAASPSVWVAATTTAPATAPATRPASPAALAPNADAPPVTQAFVGAITSDRVYVRSGPGTAYYEMGQLDHGDLVYVVGSSKGWYQILPPNGTYCMIAKELVDVAPGGGSATVKGDYVNVRAGTALNKTRDPSAVLAVVRKGTRLTVLGTIDKYVMVSPPEKAYVYLNPQFVQASPGVAYKVPELKLPAGLSGPSAVTVGQPTLPPSPTGTIELGVSIPSATGGTATPQPAPVAESLPQPRPAAFDPAASAKFSELNGRLEVERKKPLADQDLEGLLKEYQSLAGSDSVPPSVKIGAGTQATALEKGIALQKLARENAASNEELIKQRQALQDQYDTAQKQVTEYLRSGPPIAEGTLQMSTVVVGKYALVNPQTGRVVVYIDPAANIDLSIFVGKYIAVRGLTKRVEGSSLTLIQVDNATLLPSPVPSRSLGAAGTSGR